MAVTPFVVLLVVTGQIKEERQEEKKKPTSGDEVVMTNRAKTDGKRLQVGAGWHVIVMCICCGQARSGQREPY